MEYHYHFEIGDVLDAFSRCISLEEMFSMHFIRKLMHRTKDLANAASALA